MSPARKQQRLTMPEVDRLHGLAHDLEELAEQLRARAVETRPLGESRLGETLAQLHETAAQVVSVVEGRK